MWEDNKIVIKKLSKTNKEIPVKQKSINWNSKNIDSKGARVSDDNVKPGLAKIALTQFRFTERAVIVV